MLKKRIINNHLITTKMKKLLLILLCLTLVYSCKFEEVKVYEEETVIQVDTLNIEQIKIETH